MEGQIIYANEGSHLPGAERIIIREEMQAPLAVSAPDQIIVVKKGHALQSLENPKNT